MRVVLATFHRQEPALHLQNRLGEIGVASVINQEANRERFQFLAEPYASVHVEIEESNYLVATQKVTEWEASDVSLQQIIRCPPCHGSRIEYPQLTRKFLLPTLGTLLMKMGMIRRLYYCCSCQFTWSPKGDVPEAPRDSLGWPEKSKLWHPEHTKK